MASIEKVAVLGSGVMGSGIAALLANAGLDVLLLDIVPDDAVDRNILAKSAIDKQLKAKPAGGFTHKRNAKRVTPGNLEDDLAKLSDVDWVVEVVLERFDVKHGVYKKISPHMKEGAILSTNTSTIPLRELEKGVPDALQSRFMLTHFFNPPRFLPLLELAGGSQCDSALLASMETFLDERLGKGVVTCKDTPGFLGNRIGVFWLMQGLLQAMELGISVEEADAVMSKPVGIPKTGVFGLFDLIGIDLMPHIAKSMLATLPKEDRFCTIYKEPDLVTKMIAEGYTGRKGKGGFYRLNKEGGKKVKEAIDLESGDYSVAKKATLSSVNAARTGLAALVSHPDIGGQYAKKVLVNSLHYAASLVPEISDDILGIDEAMRLGYNWKYGPFELIDRLSTPEMAGVDILATLCQEEGLEVPPLLQTAQSKHFYKEEGSTRSYLTREGAYEPIPIKDGCQMLSDITRGHHPVAKNGSARLWDLGDGVLGFELTGKGNTFDPDVMSLLNKSHEFIGKDKEFKGLMIGHDGQHFSFGANLGFFMYVANLGAWPMLSDVIKGGQKTFMGLKYAPFPVVVSLAGMAMGGGCEICLHADAVQAHIESYPGLVEVGVGVIPGWGGCKEMLLRHQALANHVAEQVAREEKPSALMPQGPMPIVSKAFETIGMAKVASSAHEAQDMLILNAHSRITMNRKRVLSDAKALCLKLAEGYTPPEPMTIRLPGASAKAALEMAIEGFASSGKATPHDVVVGTHLAHVLSGGDTDMTEELTEQDLLDLEHDVFMEVVKTEGSLARLEHMLETNKPLRN